MTVKDANAKNIIKKYKGEIVGAAIGSVLSPGVGTVVGGYLGKLIVNNKGKNVSKTFSLCKGKK